MKIAKSVRGSRIGIYGVSYQPVVGDLRESPLVVDFRGVTRGIEASNLVRL